MKYFFLLPAFFLIFIIKTITAGESEAFTFDQNSLDEEFTELSSLESIVIMNEFIPLSELQQRKLIEGTAFGLNLSPGSLREDPLGIPGFWWGCFLGPVGILLAYVLSDNDKNQARMALNGCIVSGIAEVVVIVVYYIWILSLYGTY